MNVKQITVADYVDQQLALCDRPQKEVARLAEFTNPNMIVMIKQGKSKLPLNRVGLMASALRVDPLYLLRLTMNEYMPDAWKAIEEIMQQKGVVLTQEEKEVLEIYRKQTKGNSLNLPIAANRKKLEQAIATVASEVVTAKLEELKPKRKAA